MNTTYNHVFSHSQNLETQLNTLQQQNDRTTRDLSLAKQEIDDLNNKIKILDHKLLEKEKDNEKIVDQLNNRNERITEKDNQIKNNEKALTDAYDKIKKLKEDLEYHTNQSQQWKDSFNRTRDEIAKGNQIIRHLQNELRTTKSKSKIKDEVTIKQEKLLDERLHTIKEQEKRISEIKDQLNEKTEELQSITTRNEKITKELTESKERLEESTNVINYLQKQLNEDALNRPMIGSSSFGISKLTSNFDFDKYVSPTTQTDYKLRSHSSFLNKENIPPSPVQYTSIKQNPIFRSTNKSSLGNSPVYRESKPISKAEISKLLNPQLNLKLNHPLGSPTPTLTTTNPRDNIKNPLSDNSKPLFSTSTKSNHMKRFSATNNMNPSSTTTSSIPLKSNYF